MSKKKIAKSSFAVRGLFQIIHSTGHANYIVKKINKPDSSELKFMAYGLYPLPPSLKHCESVDTIYSCYLNKAHISVVNPLNKNYTSKFTIKNGLINQLKLLFD